MRAIVIGLVWVMGLCTAANAAAAPPVAPQAASTSKAAPEGGLIVMAAPLAEGGQQLTVIDPATRVMCIYHVGGKNGEISLKSVRNFTWDLRMMQFNGVNPQPEEIRSLVEQR